MNIESQWTRENLLDRFLRYVKIETTSDRHVNETPSTECQWDLLKLLAGELEALGIRDINLDDYGYLIARIPPTQDAAGAPTIGFMAHVDTSSDAPGKGVEPILHEDYDGSPIVLEGGTVIDPKEFPDLSKYIGETIITSDGTTLLGADDKAGIAEIMTAAAWIMDHPEFSHGEIEIIFTPDEETGKGLDLFPVEKFRSIYCYTFDGDGNGNIESECFYGYQAVVRFTGISIHPGTARGKLVNAATMASNFVTMLPRNESPEATDGRYGFYLPLEIKGGVADAVLEILIRDFEYSQIERRIETLKSIAQAIEGMFPGGTAEVVIKKQYDNMRTYMDKEPRGMDLLREAVRRSGTEPIEKIIRGGTDGARLSEMGIPTPNVFTGGANYHGKREWIVLSLMEKAARTALNLVELWARER
ncbi:MAG: peptidase T [Spirochaetota bacterium]